MYLIKTTEWCLCTELITVTYVNIIVPQSNYIKSVLGVQWVSPYNLHTWCIYIYIPVFIDLGFIYI